MEELQTMKGPQRFVALELFSLNRDKGLANLFEVM